MNFFVILRLLLLFLIHQAAAIDQHCLSEICAYAESGQIVIPNPLNPMASTIPLTISIGFTTFKISSSFNSNVWSINFGFNEDFLEHLRITKSSSISNSTIEYELSWHQSNPKVSNNNRLCFEAGPNQHWDSTFTSNFHNYPLSLSNVVLGQNPTLLNPFLTGSLLSSTFAQKIGSVVEHLFLSSSGYAVILDPTHSWLYQQVEDKFCFGLDEKERADDFSEEYNRLKLKILLAGSLTAVHQEAVQRYIRQNSHPSENWKLRDLDLVKYPTIPLTRSFSTNQNSIEFVGDVERLATQLNNSGVNLDKIRPLFIDWERPKGGYKLTENFKQTVLYMQSNPDLAHPTESTSPLQATLSISAFVSLQKLQDEIQDEQIQQAINQGLFLSSITLQDGFLQNEQQNQYTIDFSNPDAVDWFYKQLRKLEGEVPGGIDSFWFEDPDLQTTVLKNSLIHYAENELLAKYPNFLVTSYATAISQFPRSPRGSPVIESGFKNQGLSGTFVRLIIDLKKFDTKNIIQLLISNVLTLSLGGYQLIVPEFHNKPKDLSAINKLEELYVALIEAMTFMPTVVVPQLDKDFQILTHTSDKELTLNQAIINCFELRRTRFLPMIDALWNNWIEYGEPIIRPMWYGVPNSEKMLKIDSQFMLGPDIVVAPMPVDSMEWKEAFLTQTFVLPKGTWLQYDANGTVIDRVSIDNDGNSSKSINFAKGWVPYLVRQDRSI